MPNHTHSVCSPIAHAPSSGARRAGKSVSRQNASDTRKGGAPKKSTKERISKHGEYCSIVGTGIVFYVARSGTTPLEKEEVATAVISGDWGGIGTTIYGLTATYIYNIHLYTIDAVLT